MNAESQTTILDRMENAPQLVRQRMVKAASTLEAAGLKYAIIGGNAVALWVASVDEDAVRNTRAVDLLISREQWAEVCEAMKAAGFLFRHSSELDMFLDPVGRMKAVDAVHVIFAGERVNDRQVVPNPTLEKTEVLDGLRVIGLADLVRMHLEDLQSVGLLQPAFIETLPAELKSRYESIVNGVEERF